MICGRCITDTTYWDVSTDIGIVLQVQRMPRVPCAVGWRCFGVLSEQSGNEQVELITQQFNVLLHPKQVTFEVEVVMA